MSYSSDMPSPSHPATAVPSVLQLGCFVLAVGHAVFFPVAWLSHWWIIDAQGHGFVTDFVNVWSAGALVREGHPALVYDWDIQKVLQIKILGQDFKGYAAWHYPPPFLFIAAALAALPYVAAYMVWPVVSFVPFAFVMRAIVGRPFGWLLAASFPVVLQNTLIGQNGCLTAALVGGTLYFMPVRPILAGLCLGLLSYKPQYGILFPLVLIAAAQWRVFISAGVTVGLLVVVSGAAFGFGIWPTWLHWLPMASQAFLSEGQVPWGKIQSIFAVVRYFGGSEHLAWACQTLLTGVVAITLVVLWRSRARYAMKAAALAVGTVLSTPYIFLYDTMILAVAVAFILRECLRSGFLRFEIAMLAGVYVLLIAYTFLGAPVAFPAALVLAVVIGRRCRVRDVGA